MTLTEQTINNFEEEQKTYGTKVALSNIYAEIAYQILKAIGANGMKIKWPK